MPIYKMEGSRNKKQKYRVCVNFKDRSGNYKQIQRIAYGLTEAKLLEQSLSAEVQENMPDSNITIKELFQEYMENKKHEVRETSWKNAEALLLNNVIPFVGDVKLNKLDLKILQKWKNIILEKDTKIITKQNAYHGFRSLLNYAVKMDYIYQNPLVKLGNFKEVYFESSQDKIHYYTPEQFKEFIAVAQKHCKTLIDYGYYVFFNIAYFTGMRKGEINALKWSDIEGNIIHVRRSIAQKLKSKDVETPPKNKTSYRDIQIPKNLVTILQEHKLRQQQNENFTEDFRVCGGIACLRDTSLSNRNNQYANEAGLPHIRIHDFRHSHASLLANEGINIQEIARRLGHSKIEITWNTYAHLYPREEERAISILEKI